MPIVSIGFFLFNRKLHCIRIFQFVKQITVIKYAMTVI